MAGFNASVDEPSMEGFTEALAGVFKNSANR